ncbi:hypothetical protein FRC19_004644 [Serendipita sp. 401]|nr:hypothetical protein FRC19_004644 [Serendipita sp. 401]KAG9053150.1 hypothetical protein FS842_008610 [Serendipita sp. 407]
MQRSHRCQKPCLKAFQTHQALAAHRSSTVECLQRYNNYLESLITNLTGLELGEITSDDDANVDMEDNFNDDQNHLFLFGDDPSEMYSRPIQATEWMGMSASMGEPLDGAGLFYEESPDNAGEIIDHQPSVFEQWCSTHRDQYNGNLYYPFASEAEWKLAVWLHESNLSLSEIDKFLKLPYVQAHPLSFQSGAALRDRISQMSDPTPRWMAKTITPDYGAPLDPITLFYRNPIHLVEDLFSRPSLSPAMEFSPRRVWEDDAKDTRIYNEMSTGDWWWRVQESLPQGSTVVPILLGLDATHLTNFAGDKKAWPVYMSIGNIRSKTRNTPSEGAWKLLAYIPVADWTDDDTVCGTLTMRLYHQCMEFLLQSLIKPGTEGIRIVDSHGAVRVCYPRVAAHIADYPEQVLINCAPRNHSPVTTASYKDLDDPNPHPPCTRDHIFSCLSAVCAKENPTNIHQYTKAAALVGLNGVDKPYWRNLPGVEPEYYLPPDILHGVIRFWRDHILKWTQSLVGAAELDRRLRVLQPTIGFRHFKSGIGHLSQWTMREDRELQRVFVAVVAGAPRITATVLENLRAFHDFLYLVQYRSHSDATLAYVEDALRVFHRTKDVYIKAGVCRGARGVLDHFRISKLALFHHYCPHIRELGSSPQFSTEIVELHHRPLAKDAYKSTNRKNFMYQMCLVLDRNERVNCRQEFFIWHEKQNEFKQLEDRFAMHTPRYRAWAIDNILANTSQEMEADELIPFSRNRSLRLTKRPTRSHVTIELVSRLYRLPCLHQEICNFLLETRPTAHMQIDDIDVWTKLRMHLSSVQDDDELAPMRTVEALPPSEELPYGRCNCVLVHDSEEAAVVGIHGYRVAQIRLLFLIHFTDQRIQPLPLAYVEYFSRPRRNVERGICMYEVSRQDRHGVRTGEVIPMEAIARFVQLIPKFGSVARVDLSSINSMDTCRDYYVNSFADKEIYQSVY